MSAVIEKAVATKLKQLGIDWVTLESLAIRAADKAVNATVSLEGESTPVELTALYRVDGDLLIVESVETSKPWISKALTLALETKGSSFPLPSGMAGMAVRMML